MNRPNIDDENSLTHRALDALLAFDTATPVERLNRLARWAERIGYGFNDLNLSQLVRLYRCQMAAEHDYTLDEWTEDQRKAALRFGWVPEWKEEKGREFPVEYPEADRARDLIATLRTKLREDLPVSVLCDAWELTAQHGAARLNADEWLLLQSWALQSSNRLLAAATALGELARLRLRLEGERKE